MESELADQVKNADSHLLAIQVTTNADHNSLPSLTAQSFDVLPSRLSAPDLIQALKQSSQTPVPCIKLMEKTAMENKCGFFNRNIQLR